ncbi:MAG: carbohydrate binding family 9 domain-containing protein [FCB group bacterium]|nr:carbohydrate binding family 9 domain-containing protein [FCB group bacterium]MBL7120950.1 carbohydrate binding family 9 domain-containing protein [Candidatus Neomarinimicrobiota bacterium]
MKFTIIFFCIIAGLLGYDEPYDPNNYREREIRSVRISEPLDIDGHLDEALYQGISYSDFIQYEPFNGAKASQKTDMWIAYDDAAIYVGARMWDTSPDSVVGRIGRRDAYLNSDIFEVIIDSYHDKRSGFSFQINPAGSMRDEVYFNDSWTDDSWDGIWEGKTRIDDRGWTAEMRIPLSQLRFSEKEEYVWGILPTRYIQRAGEWDYFVYFPLNESGAMSRTADLTEIRNIHPPKRREYMPYVTASASNLPNSKDNTFIEGKDSDFGVGADIKLGIGANLTVDATINPDFGQVEADPSSINLSDHETYYSEKRPFFLEGRSIFNFGNGGPTNNIGINFGEPRFFYSRRIGRPPQGYKYSIDADSLDQPSNTRILGAAKISGKVGDNWSVGGLTALTNREYAHYYENSKIIDEQVEPYTSYNVLRSLKEFDDGRYGLGFMGTYTHRIMDGIELLGDFDDQHESADLLSEKGLGLGIDGWAFLGENRDWALGGWGGFSQINGTESRIFDLQNNSSHYFQRPDAVHVKLDTNATSLSGHAGRIKLNKEAGTVTFNAALGWISPGFESNDLGLTGSTDVINKHIMLGYRWLDRGQYIRSANASVIYANNHDFDWVKTSDVFFGMGQVRFVNFWNIHVDGGYALENMSNNNLRGGPRVLEPGEAFLSGNLSSDYRKNLSFNWSYNYGSEDDGGHETGLSMHVNMKIGDRLNLSFGPAIFWDTEMAQYIETIDDPANTQMFGKRYVVSQLDQTITSADIRIDFPITPQFTLEGYFQPFFAVGDYSGFKEYKRPESNEFLVYGEEGSTIDENFVIDPTGGSDDDAFTLYNPDFNYKALIGTLVLRWEFSPGSTMFFVWTHNGSNYENQGVFDFAQDFDTLLKSEADDIFALKMSYWFGQ